MKTSEASIIAYVSGNFSLNASGRVHLTCSRVGVHCSSERCLCKKEIQVMNYLETVEAAIPKHTAISLPAVFSADSSLHSLGSSCTL